MYEADLDELNGTSVCNILKRRESISNIQQCLVKKILKNMWEKWGDRWGSNPRQPESQSGALPTELRSPHVFGADFIHGLGTKSQ